MYCSYRFAFIISVLNFIFFDSACRGAEVQFNPGAASDVASGAVQSAIILGPVTIGTPTLGDPSGTSLIDVTIGGLIIPNPNQFQFYCPNGNTFSLESGMQAINDAIANAAGGLLSNGNYGNGLEGIKTSASGPNDVVGWIPNSVSQYDMWRGVDLTQPSLANDPNLVLIGDTYPGDILLNGTPATTSELATISANVASGATNTTWSDGDSFYQGAVTQRDLTAAQAVEGDATLYPVDPTYTNPVPEPANIGLLSAAGLFFSAAVRLRVIGRLPT